MSNNIKGVIARGAFYGQKILKTGALLLQTNFEEDQFPKVNLNHIPQEFRSRITIPEIRGRGYANVLGVNLLVEQVVSSVSFSQFIYKKRESRMDARRDVNPEILYFTGQKKIVEKIVGYKRFFRKTPIPSHEERAKTISDLLPQVSSQEKVRFLEYANYFNKGYPDKFGRRGRHFMGSIALPQSVGMDLICEIEKDANILHAIFHYFYYPCHGQVIQPALSRNGTIELFSSEYEVYPHDLLKDPSKTFSYNPLSLADVTFEND